MACLMGRAPCKWPHGLLAKCAPPALTAFQQHWAVASAIRLWDVARALLQRAVSTWSAVAVSTYSLSHIAPRVGGSLCALPPLVGIT